MKKMEGRRRKKRRKEGGRDREERRERREKKENSYRQQIKILAPKQELLCWLQSADPAEDNELSNGTLSTVGCPCPLWGVLVHCGVSLSTAGCPSETLTRVNSTWVLRIHV